MIERKSVTLSDYMTDEKETAPRTGATKDEIALELMRYISTTTGMGKTSSGAGFGGKSPKTPEEQVDTLLQLFEKCRQAVGK
jgi:hypothetical protein